MANTTNLNLSKLAGTEKLKTFPSPYNDNMDAIDGAFGAGFGVSGKPTVNAEINSLADGLAIIANGNTHAAITSGQFVYVRNHGSLSNGLYVATSNISANGTLSGSNLTADSSGGLNALNAKMSYNFGEKTLASFQTTLETKMSEYATGESFSFYVNITDNISPIGAGGWTGVAIRAGSATRINVTIKAAGNSTAKTVNGSKYADGWAWQEVVNAENFYSYHYNGSSFTIQLNEKDSSRFWMGLMYLANSSTAFSIYGIFIDVEDNVTVSKLAGNSTRTFTGSVSGTTLTLTADSTVYGGIRVVKLG